MQKRLLLGLVAVVGLTLGGWNFFRLTPPEPGVTLENFRRLKVGMTQGEVEAVLGGRGEHLGNFTGGYIMYWPGQEGAVGVHFGLEKLSGASWREPGKDDIQLNGGW